MPQGPQEEAHGTGTGNWQLIPLQAGSFPCTGVPSIGFPSGVTHQQKPLVTWHCLSVYVPSSLHSGMYTPKVGRRAISRASFLSRTQSLLELSASEAEN